jgi:CubicO group peptidase (beta-lactamase class C family)
MDERVLTPLGMDKSTYENPLPAVYHTLAATGYRANGREVEGKWPIYPEMAAAGLWTTPSQLIRYVQGIQNIYLKNEKGIISKALTLEMLTPGMNNHGLGPGIGKDELWWGHGGADEGFRAQMVAWKNQPNAIVVMVNSDNGTIINEVLIAIAKTYGWPGFGPTIKKVIPLDPSIGQAIEGDWEIDRVGPARLSFEDGHLIITGSFLDKPVVLLAENDSTFFDRTDGQQITFSKTEGKINRLRVGQLSGKKTIRFQE